MASGDSLIIFTALHNEAPELNYASLGWRNQHPVLEFDQTTNESAVFSGVMPRNYSGGGISVHIHYAMKTDTLGRIRWQAAFERIGDQGQNIDADGFAAAHDFQLAYVPSTCGHIGIESFTFNDGAEIDNVAAGEGFRLKITRNAGSDDAVDDAQLVRVELKES